MASLFKKPVLQSGKPKIGLHNAEFQSIKDQLRKRSRAKTKAAEAVVLEW